MTQRARRGRREPVVEHIRGILASREIQNESLVVAVSGGADSMALLTALLELRDDLQLRLLVAHFDHQLRADSADDARWLERHCVSINVEFIAGQPATAAPPTHVEAWARKVRYDFLETIASNAGARWIAVGHTANDQAETVLHHILRGTGLRGAAGIPKVRRLPSGARIVRPCLALSRLDLELYLRSAGIVSREDASNRDPRFTRNRIRNELLPFLQERFNPRAPQALCRLAEQAQGFSRLIRNRASRLLDRALLEQSDQCVRMTTAEFGRRNRWIVQEAAVVLWTRRGWPRVGMSAAHWKRVADLLKDEGPAQVSLPGAIMATRRGGLAVFERTPRTA